MQHGAGKQLSAFADVACKGSFGPGEPATVMSDRQTRLSGRKRGCRPLSGLSLVIIGSSERTEPIAPGQSARRNGNSHRTLIAPAIGATAIADCLLPANWPRNCEYGPIFDPLRPDLKERLRSATPRFLVGPRMQHHCMRY
jgi:hypothetical protein